MALYQVGSDKKRLITLIEFSYAFLLMVISFIIVFLLLNNYPIIVGYIGIFIGIIFCLWVILRTYIIEFE